MSLRLLALAGCVGAGLASLGGCGGADEGGAVLLAGANDAGTTDAAATADAQPAAPVADAGSGCRGSEQSSRGDVQTSSSGFYGTGLGPDLAVAQPSSGQFVVTVTEPYSQSASRVSFQALTPNTALADTGQVLTASDVPVPDDVTSPLAVSITSGALSTVDGWTYLGLRGTAGAAGDITVTYLVACPTPAEAPSPVTATPDATIARLYTACIDTTDQASVYPAGGTVQLAVSGDTITATVSLDTFAQATVAFAADSASTAVLMPGQQAQLTSLSCGTDAAMAEASGPVALSGGSFAVVGDVLYLDLTGSNACGQDATIELACTVPAVHQ